MPSFSDAACTPPAQTLTIARDQSVAKLYLRAPRTATAQLSANHVDFVSSPPTALTVVAP